MPLSADKLARCNEALTALHQLRGDYGDVLIVLDYVSLADVNNYQSDTDDKRAGDVLTEEEMSGVLWHVGKQVGGTSPDLIAAHVEYALDEHTRRNTPQ
jgi:hypothetical protein